MTMTKDIARPWPRDLNRRVQHAMKLPVSLEVRTVAAVGYIQEYVNREQNRARQKLESHRAKSRKN